MSLPSSHSCFIILHSTVITVWHTMYFCAYLFIVYLLPPGWKLQEGRDLYYIHENSVWNVVTFQQLSFKLIYVFKHFLEISIWLHWRISNECSETALDGRFISLSLMVTVPSAFLPLREITSLLQDTDSPTVEQGNWMKFLPLEKSHLAPFLHIFII